MSPVVPDMRLWDQRKTHNQSRCLVMLLRLKTFVRLQMFNVGQFVKEMEKLWALHGIIPQTFTVPLSGLTGPVSHYPGKSKTGTHKDVHFSVKYCLKAASGRKMQMLIVYLHG